MKTHRSPAILSIEILNFRCTLSSKTIWFQQ